MRSNLVVLVIACFVVAVSATCQLPAIAPYDQLLPFKFVTIGQVCNGVNPLIQPVDTSLSITDPERGCTSCCKNFQTCLPSNVSSAESGLYTCNEISQNATCDPTWATLYNINPCGPTMQCLPVNGDPTDNRCFVVDHLENGAVCIINEQCQSRNCAPNMTLATGFGLRRAVNVTGLPFCQPLDPLQPCNSQADCPAHQWCNLANNSCMAPIPQNGDCSAIASYYNTTMDLPNYVCAPGTACLRSVNAKTGASYSCVAYYTQSKNNPTCYRDAWWNCQFGYYCNTSDVDESASAQGTCIVSNQAGAIGDKCKNFPLTSGGQSECYWGTGCSCFTTTNNSNSGQCTRMYNTNCPIQLRNLVSCISSNNCPHDGAQLLGGNASPYAASTVVGSCIQTYCSSEHANLIKCQNDINSPNSIVSPAFIPTTYPNNDYTNGSSGLQGWEIGLIIVGIAVAIIIIVVIVVAIVRRKSNSAYQPLE